MGTRTILADAVLITTQTTGTGTYSLGDALTGHCHPADVPITSGSRISDTVVDNLTAPTLRETGEGVLSSGSPWTLTRATIRRSLNGRVASGSAIYWPVGTRYLYVTPLAANTPQYDTDTPAAPHLLSNAADAPIKPQTPQPARPAIRPKKPPPARAGIKRDGVFTDAPSARRLRTQPDLMNFPG